VSPAPIVSRRELALTWAFACAATVLAFVRAVFSNDIFIERDILRVYYPAHQYWAQRIAGLEFPQWYPFDGMGQPFVGAVVTSPFHPFNLLFLAFDSGVALKAAMLASYPALFVGVYLLVRSFDGRPMAAALGAMTAAFNGYAIGITNNMAYLWSMAAVPWVWLYASRLFRSPTAGGVLGTAAALALVLFGGDSQSFVVAGASVVVWWVAARWALGARTGFGWLGAALALAAALGAVQLLPASQVFRDADPGAQSINDAMQWSLHPIRLLELAFGPINSFDAATPDVLNLYYGLFGNNGTHSLWVNSIHVGAVALALCALACWELRNQRLMFAGILGGLFVFSLMLGRYGVLYGALYRLGPLWRPFPYPQKLTPFLLLLVALGAAAGLELVLRREALRSRLLRLMLGAALLVAVAGVVERTWSPYSVLLRWLWMGTPKPTTLATTSELMVDGALATAGQLLIASLALWRASTVKPVAGLLVALVYGGQVLANEHLYLLGIPELIREPGGFISLIDRREPNRALGQFRVLNMSGSFFLGKLNEARRSDALSVATITKLDPDTPGIWGLEVANAYLPATSRRVHAMLESTGLPVQRTTFLSNIRYMTVEDLWFAGRHGAAAAVVGEDGTLGVLLLNNPYAKSRAWFSQPVCEANANVVGAALRYSSHSQERTPVECVTPLQVSDGTGTVTVLEYRPESVLLEVTATNTGVVVLADPYYSGWSATVDGAPADVLAANLAFRAVAVPGGKHEVHFTYRTPLLAEGAATSLLSLILAIALVLRAARRPPPALASA